ncbi:H-NS family nucleoid-associated regulatory protein [Caballeronia sp.]|uniref:H-NS family nucleoid-associated regulatory protein n=1 Tax=Caballeronia sp. TaxID=1931223 RepID=UPI003C6ED948
MDERKRDSIIAYLRSRMAEFGITETALAEALAEEPVSVTPPPLTNSAPHLAKRALPSMPQMPQNANGTTPAFRSANGDTWDGQGEMPEWLKRAVHAGQDIEFYRV